MISHAKSFCVSDLKLTSEGLESCGITQRLLDQLRPLLSLPSVACTHDDELSFFHTKKGSMRIEKPSR